jgi:hypothetical protein
MLLGSARPAALAGVVLNDIGPVIEPRGIARIKSYVGRLPQPKSFEEAAAFMRQLFGPQFPALSADDWMELAQRVFRDQDGRIIPDYDPELARVLRDVDIERPLSPLWNRFACLRAHAHHPRRKLGPAVTRDLRGHAGTATAVRRGGRAGPGPCAALD